VQCIRRTGKLAYPIVTDRSGFAGPPMQAIVARQIQAFKQFPLRQKPAAFHLDAVLAQMQEATSSGYH